MFDGKTLGGGRRKNGSHTRRLAQQARDDLHVQLSIEQVHYYHIGNTQKQCRDACAPQTIVTQREGGSSSPTTEGKYYE